MKADRCQGITQDGKPCGAKARPGSPWCPWHDPDPDLRERHRAWSAKGGQGRSNAARARKALAGDLRDMLGVKARLLAAMEKVEAGELEPGAANALANLARAVVTVSGVADFEAQLDQMRHDLADLKGA